MKKTALFLVIALCSCMAFTACDKGGDSVSESSSSVETSTSDGVSSSDETQSSVETSADSSEQASAKEENVYTIYYQVNSPDNSTASINGEAQTVRYGEAFTLRTPHCPGYDFVCWKKQGEDKAFTAGTYSLQCDVTLVATWEMDENDSYWWTENG